MFPQDHGASHNTLAHYKGLHKKSEMSAKNTIITEVNQYTHQCMSTRQDNRTVLIGKLVQQLSVKC